MIWVGLIYETYAGLPFTVTETPSRCVGSLLSRKSLPVQDRVVADKFAPKMEIHAPGEMPGWKLAAFTTPLMLATGAPTVSVTTTACEAIAAAEIVMVPE